jgi:hypothetical protein
VWYKLPENAKTTMNEKSKSISEDAMSRQRRSGETSDASNLEPKELRELALLELRRRKLLRELVDVEYQASRLTLEIEFKGIEVSWLTNREPFRL